MRLTQDRLPDAEPHYDEPDSYPIAREAITAFAKYGSLDDEIGAGLLN
jgi:hypothetical protein